jgi:hypothetical protein
MASTVLPSQCAPLPAPDEAALLALRQRLLDYGCEVPEVVDHGLIGSCVWWWFLVGSSLVTALKGWIDLGLPYLPSDLGLPYLPLNLGLPYLPSGLEGGRST